MRKQVSPKRSWSLRGDVMADLFFSNNLQFPFIPSYKQFSISIRHCCVRAQLLSPHSISANMSSDSDATFLSSSSSTPFQLDDPQIRRLSMLLPLLLSLAPPRQAPESDSGSPRGRVRILIVDPSAGAMIVIEGSGDLQYELQGLSGKTGVLPASKDSIQAMPRVGVTEEDADCPICLEAYEMGGEAREMPCKHKFHSECIEKWLGLHGSCPICRYAMPAEEENTSIAIMGSEGEQEGGERRESGEGLVSVSVWVRSLDEEDDEDDDDDDDPMEVDSESDHGTGGSNSDSREGNSSEYEDSSMMMDQEAQDMEF